MKKTNTLFEQNFENSLNRPLAERCRPEKLSEIIGHGALISEDGGLYKQIKSGYLPSLILWGPPGVGKTTLARVLASEMNYLYEPISAVTSGVKDVKDIIEEARKQIGYYNKNTVLFIDEIHRFNKAQQDALLHAVEDGTIVLIGATTENPSFEINSALLSRCQVLKLEPLEKEDLLHIIQNALAGDSVLSRYKIVIDGMDDLLYYGSGDARRTLNLLEIAFYMSDKTGDKLSISDELIKKAASQNPLYYDKKGDYHYDTISAFIKSVRGSDPDGAVYWLARMLESGEDPVFIARRLIILASEDIGNAEPYALSLANAGFEAVKNIGMPEARIVLSQVCTYLASVPKSNAAYLAIDSAIREVKNGGVQSVPLHLRNAPTNLMKDLDYGKDYRYPHDHPGHFIGQDYLPKNLKGKRFYFPTDQGRESNLKAYIEGKWPDKREKKK
ncbi:MAG: replication-associated recombination protein A [Calditrichaceae bacterium]